MQPGDLNTKRSLIHIKNMTSNSCVRIIREDLERTGFIRVHYVALGEAEISYDPQIISEGFLDALLRNNGFELITDKDTKLIELIKTSVIQLIYYGGNTNSLIRNSDYLSERIGYPYAYLSKLFSEKTGTTLEKYIILIKIEKIKELISYEEMTLSEIAFQMGYSSVQYLSNQFKQFTGYSVTDYKNLVNKPRTALHQIINN